MPKKRSPCPTCGSTVYGEYGDVAGKLLEAAKAMVAETDHEPNDDTVGACLGLEIAIAKAEGRS